ncbi:MAG TPA: alginate lyase, partial [Firmicutes bacterium]|nr:alginate lyase [Bacillota bacterium]
MKFRRMIFAAIVMAVFSFGWVNAAIKPGNPDSLILYDAPQLDIVKSAIHGVTVSPWNDVVKKLTKDADKLLTQPPYAVSAKKVLPPSGDSHDYVSLATYYWPDPLKPDGLPYWNQDGKVNPEREDGDRYDSIRMSRMVYAVDTLAFVYSVTDHEAYAVKAVEFIKTWFINPDTCMNPNLNFGQGVPGKATGRCSGIIDTSTLIQIVDAAQLLSTSDCFSANDQRSLKNWFRNYLDWLQSSPLGRQEAATANNHAVWYDAQIAAFAFYTGQTRRAADIVESAKIRRVQTQIESDGAMPKEQARTRSMHYSIYNLQAFITLARIGDKVGVNLWDYQSPDGRGVRKALDYLIPYLLQQKTWHFQTIISENERGFARYLNLAELHYRSGKYQEA